MPSNCSYPFSIALVPAGPPAPDHFLLRPQLLTRI